MTFATIASPDQLHERLGDPGVAIFDCRHALDDFALGRRLYDESHIPGAFFADVEADLSGAKTANNGGRHPMPDPESFARFLRVRGVGDATQIVAYDEGADIFAPRLWFLARWIGHDAVAVLDGGFAAWQRLGYPVTAAPVQPVREGALTIRLHPEYVVDADYVQQHLRSDGMQLIDARAKNRYTGEAKSMDLVAGHIPGAKSRYFEENFRPDGTLKSPHELREEFERAGFDPMRTVHQCGSGVSATVNYLAMQHAGLAGSRLYNGSWSEWISDPSRPVATGSEP